METANDRYAELPGAGELNTYVAGFTKKQNVRFTLSGYGLSGTTPRTTSFRERLMGTSTSSTTGPVTRYNLKTTANPSQGKAGTCSGTPAARSWPRAPTRSWPSRPSG